MKSRFSTAGYMIHGLFMLLCVAGCKGPTSSESEPLAGNGAAFLLSEEPANAQSVSACRSLVEESEEPMEVVLVGRVGGLGQPTWEPDRAVFMIADLALQEHEDEEDEAAPHDAENCPFCRAKKKKELAGLAMIEIVDSDGSTPDVSAQKLLGLSEGQTIVIRGTAEPNKLGMLLVRTSGVFIRSDGG